MIGGTKARDRWVHANMAHSDVTACLVTGWTRLARRVSEEFGSDRITVRHRLAELIGEKDCRVFIIDTKVSDFDIWPAPLLLDPEARSKQWLFLLADPAGASSLTNLPSDSTFFERRIGVIDSLVHHLNRRFDPASAKQISSVEYVPAVRAFVVRMGNASTYALKLDDLPEADSSDVAKCYLGRDHSYFKVRQDSGNSFEVPWDDVLYHCEPQYEYYKGRQSRRDDSDRVARIGNRVRELRTMNGLSVTALAGRAGMQRPNLSRLEHGRHMPSLETLERIAEALEITVAELVSRE